MSPTDEPRVPGGTTASAQIDPQAAGTPAPTPARVPSATPSAPAAAPSGVAPEDVAGVSAGPVSGPPVTRTRTSQTWGALSAGLFFLVVVLVFILQNLKSVRVHFFWATWTVPLAVDLLLATILGALIMFAVGSLRIVQLRRAAKHPEATRAKAGRPA